MQYWIAFWSGSPAGRRSFAPIMGVKQTTFTREECQDKVRLHLDGQCRLLATVVNICPLERLKTVQIQGFVPGAQLLLGVLAAV